MAFNPEIKGYMTFGKSFSRGAAFPLEAYEIWTDYDALVAYAANTDPNKDPSYIGQKVAYIDTANNKVVHYGIEIDGTLKELGATPIGDEKSIIVDEINHTISLKGIEGLIFERDILGEDGAPTGEKEEVKFQPLMTKNGLVWVEPSQTTVEGLATLLSELTARVKALEDNAVVKKELADIIAELEGKINAVDFVDNDELAAAIKIEMDRAQAAEKKNADEIARIDALLNVVDSEDAIISLKELAIWVEAHNTEVIPVINQHTEDLAILKEKVAANETAVSTTLPNAIAQALADAKAYTDQKMVKADGTSIVNNEGTFSLGAVSTDNLVQGTMTLVLNGGNSSVVD